MSQISISIDDEILVNSLDAFIGHGEIRDLIKDMFTHNDKAKKLLGRLLLGEKLAQKPKLNQMGLFKIQGQWFTNRDTTKDTDLDLKGYISCKVIRLGSYTDYSSIQVEFPTYDDAGKVEIVSTGLDYDEFIWLEDDKILNVEF
jgi:hypothetical protein